MPLRHGSIDSESATDEMRACSLNNRADIYDDSEQTDLAIADRTAVLSLHETTYDRRYIALGRRARALWKSGDHAGAYRDIDTILATPDIVVAQKMEARLTRAHWLIDSGMGEQAEADLAVVVSSVRNFRHVEEGARTLLETLRGAGPSE